MAGHLPQVTYTPAATAQGMTTTVPKETTETDSNSLRASPPKKCKLVAVEQSSPANTATLLQTSIIAATTSSPVVPKPIETVSIPAGKPSIVSHLICFTI